MRPRISLITLGVANLSAAVDFYARGLGLPRRSLSPEADAQVAFFALAGTWLGLYGRAALAADAGMPAAGSGFAGVALAHNVDSPAAVDALLADAVRAGARLIKPGQNTDWGGYSGYFADLDGHLWEVAHNPHLWIGPPD